MRQKEKGRKSQRVEGEKDRNKEVGAQNERQRGQGLKKVGGVQTHGGLFGYGLLSCHGLICGFISL